MTQGFLNGPQGAPGTLLSSPSQNDSALIGRTTSINYVNGWLIVGAEAPGSTANADLSLRVYDISDPSAPIRRYPTDFNLNYPSNRWHQGNAGWNAHGSAQSGSYLLPMPVLRVQTFGGPVELGGTAGIPGLAEWPLGYNRSSQAGPWVSTMLWYNSPDQDIEIERAAIGQNGVVTFQTLATIDHVGEFGGGDWHPMFFGDLLIYVRSGGAARDGVVVYRLQYNHFEDDNSANDTITPQFVGSLDGGFSGYWPTLFSDGAGLYVIGSATNILTAADISDAAEPGGDDHISVAATLTIPDFTNASYPVFQDQFGFIHNRKINMTAFLAGDPNAVVLTLNEGAPNNIDTSQMSIALGNLWITGGYPHPGRSQGMAVWVHQSAPDSTPPAVTFHIPQANRTNYPRFAPLSFLLHEHPRHGGLRNGIDFAVRPVLPDESLGAFVPGFLIHDFSGVLTFTPAGGLAAESTYQVDFFSDDSDPNNPIGFFDAAGNVIDAYSFRFSTGGNVNALPPPVFSTLSASNPQPSPGDPLTVTATAAGTGLIEYRFNFDGTWTPWSTTPSEGHAYGNPGRPRVLVQVRDESGLIVTRTLNLLVAEAPVGPLPTQSSSMAIGDDPLGRRLWVVNPDANTVSVVDAENGAKVAEYPVGENPRSIARDGNGRYWITCHRSDEIRVLNPDGSQHTVISVPYGSAPFGIAASPNGQSLFVSLYGSGRLHRYSAANPAAAPLVQTIFPTPRAIAVSGNGSRVLVTRFLSPDLEAEIAEFSGSSLNPVHTYRLSSANPIDGGDRASGVPNYLSGIAISPDGTRAAVVSKQDNILRGQLYGVGDLTFETSVRAVISFLDLTNYAEIRHTRRDFDNSDSPSAVTYSPRGDMLFVALQGKNRIVGLDALSLLPVIAPNTAGSTETSPAVLTLDLGTGLAPQGVLLDPASGHLFSQDFMGRTVTVFDAAAFLDENRTSFPTLATTGTLGIESLAPDVLLGKQIFYNAADPRMSADSYISCASCHLDGGHDGRVWDFTGREEGLRRTTDLRGRAGMGQGNVHWSANFDEIQDFEHDIRGPFGGTGFLPGTASEFAAAHPSPASSKAGLHPDLDAIAAYVTSLSAQTVPRSPHREADGAMTPAAIRGRDVFVSQSCVTCHAGDGFTDSANSLVGNPFLHDVGTQSGLSGQRLGESLDGIDTPTLHGLHAARTYLHHGQASTLEDVFSYAGGTLLLASQAQILNPGPVAASSDSPFEGGGGFVRGVLGGTMLQLGGASGNGIRFANVDGGPTGGAARIAVRYLVQYANATARLRVNGVDQTMNLLRQYPDNNWQISGWRWITVQAPLNAGPTNTIDVLRNNSDIQINGLLVSNAENLAQAQPHRSVQSLPANERSDLFAYLQQLDGRSDDGALPADPNTPSVSITPDVNADPAAPFIDVDIVFSLPVAGLDISDFVIGGTAGATLSHLTTITPGTHFQLRVSGFAQAGTITVQLPQGVVSGEFPGSTNSASSVSQVAYAPRIVDELAGLSDEFDDAASLSQWMNNDAVEGWDANKLEQWDIDASSAGRMRLMPYSSSWYQDFTGAYVFKEVTGDFVLTTRLDVSRRNNEPGRPTSDYSLAGLMVRAPRGITQAAPQPGYPSNVVLPVPPPAQGQPNHYVTDWQPGTENYIFLSYGFGNNAVNNNPNQWQYEVKTTTNGVSTLYPRAHGVPAGESNATLQIVRRGSTFLLLRRHGNGPWIIENRFERPDLPQTVQVGITTYTDWNLVANGWDYVSPVQPYHQNRIVNVGVGNPDLVADLDFVRLQRPDPSLTQNLLQATTFTGPNGPVVELSGSNLAAWLGEAASHPAPPPSQTYAEWLGQFLVPEQLVIPANTDPLADVFGSGHANLINFLLGGAPAPAPTLDAVETGPGDFQLRYLVGRNPMARGWRLIVETSTDLITWTPVATSEDGAPATGSGAEGEIPGNPPRMVIGPGQLPEPSPPRFYRTRAEQLP